MGKIITKSQPCLDQVNCGSSDARQIYEDGTSFCFSCNSFFKADHDNTTIVPVVKPEPKLRENTLEFISKLGSRGFKERQIEKLVCEFFNVKVTYNENGEIDSHYYPYSNGGFKHRMLPKIFSWVGTSGGLFGKDNFSSGGKRLVITEGEIDALSVAQAYYDKYKKFYPVVSVPSATHAHKELLDNRDWVRSFEEVVLCFDDDKAGNEARDKAISIIGIDKVKLWKPPCKDANEVLLKHGYAKVLQCIWDAETWSPVGIIKKEELWTALTEFNSKVSVPYSDCLAGVNSKTKGHREGDIVLFISGTGSGKSTLLREDMLHILETTNDKIGVISLEETPADTARKLSGMYLRKNPAFEEIPIDELKKGFDAVFGSDRVVLLDHQGAIKDSSIVDQMEYMCLIGCKYIYVDHITILVSEGADGLTGNEAIDKVMNDLLRLVKKHPVWIGLVSHLRKTSQGGRSFEEGKLPTMDDIRGSGSIKQVSMDIIAFARNLMAEDENERNTISIAVLKCRYSGLTGPVQGAKYDLKTGRLTKTEFVGEAFETF
jgi:twinkle protein